MTRNTDNKPTGASHFYNSKSWFFPPISVDEGQVDNINSDMNMVSILSIYIESKKMHYTVDTVLW